MWFLTSLIMITLINLMVVYPSELFKVNLLFLLPAQLNGKQSQILHDHSPRFAVLSSDCCHRNMYSLGPQNKGEILPDPEGITFLPQINKRMYKRITRARSIYQTIMIHAIRLQINFLASVEGPLRRFPSFLPAFQNYRLKF